MTRVAYAFLPVAVNLVGILTGYLAGWGITDLLAVPSSLWLSCMVVCGLVGVAVAGVVRAYLPEGRQ